MRSFILTLIVLIAGAIAAPSINHVLHEKRDRLPLGWGQPQYLDGKAVLPMKVALTQSNLHKAEEYLMDVSHPDSPNFGQHWSAKKIAETFAPSRESVDTVTQWLRSSGIAPERISNSQSLGWLRFDATVEEAENLLKTKYRKYTHISGKSHVACTEYHVPEHVSRHVDLITPTVHFDSKIPMVQDEWERKNRRAAPEATTVAAAGHPVKTHAALGVGAPGSGSLPKKGTNINIKGLLDELKNCNRFITPNCLRALYKFLPGVSANPKNSYGIVEYTPQSYLQGDLDLFFANFSKNQVQRTPILNSIDGGVPQTTNQGFNFNGESDLDLEYAMALINPQKTTLYQVGDFVEGASFNNFLDAIDASYCTYLGGDDPLQDATYPDPYPGGYTGPQNCGGFAATKVISTSYGYNEADLTAPYEQRQCNEYMKLGLAGSTILYSSGDYGVAGNRGQCIDANGTYNNGSSGKFNPSFPASCPYVTAVGATQIKPNASVTAPETACETVIYSGGGFSNVFGLPSYQAAAVNSFFTNYPPPYTAAQYNNSRAARGFPDISANGANYVVAVDGIFALVYGTSASSPVVGAIITLVNEARFAIGKGSVGFINPTLYANPEILNDITEGGNQGCGTPGFSSVAGWDPVTGLGTPNFPKLLAKFLALYCLRKAAFRVLSSSTASLSSRTRTLTTIAPFQSRLQTLRLSASPVQRRWASEDATQSEPSADRETEAQHGDNSIAASSETHSAAAEEQRSSLADRAKSTASAVADQASDAASQVGAAASAAVGATSSEVSPPEQSTKSVYIGNLFFDVKEDDLKKEFSRAGNVLSTKIIYDQRGLSKGFGYVEFDSAEGAETAISMFNMQNFEGRRMTVQHTIPRKAPTPRRGNAPLNEPHAPSKTLFIGNMAFDMSDRDLNNLFREIKNVVDVRVAIDRRTGQPRGFAHADFVDVASAEKAMAELADKEVCGRFLRVDFSSSSR